MLVPCLLRFEFAAFACDSMQISIRFNGLQKGVIRPCATLGSDMRLAQTDLKSSIRRFEPDRRPIAGSFAELLQAAPTPSQSRLNT